MTVMPTLTDQTPPDDNVAGQGPIINGDKVNIRLTHPNMFRIVMLYGIGFIVLGINFYVFTPTFLIWDMPNDLWATIFLLLGAAKITFLALWRNRQLLRATEGLAIAYLLFFAAGASQPVWEGTGSAQLPLLYLGWAAIHLPLMLEPIVNPWTARREDS